MPTPHLSTPHLSTPHTSARAASTATRRLALGAAALLLCASGAFAQAGGPTPGPTSGRSDCSMPPHSSATPPDQGPGSGTAPGSSGSTAWTGGTGGSHTGTTPHAPTPASPTAQPEVVQGVDPKAAPAQGNC